MQPMSVESLDASLPAEILRLHFGSKAANLALLRRIIPECVPEGFCIDAEVCRRVVAAAGIEADLEALDRTLKGGDGESGISEMAAAVRRRLLLVPVPGHLLSAIESFLARFGTEDAYAVRSSAIGEDLPSASFAGMHDSFLNRKGVHSIFDAVRRCWSSLFSERSIVYRFQRRVRQRDAAMAIVIQKQLFPDVSGVMFTADPLTGNRRGLVISAAFGLGTGVAAGTVDPDVYRLFDGKIVETRIGGKARLDIPSPAGEGVEQVESAENTAGSRALDDGRIAKLAALGRKLEAAMHPQTPSPTAGDYSGRVPLDIEWCLCGDAVRILQARPIPVLFPVPGVSDGKLHVYASISHFQQMTEAMSPLGFSIFTLPTNRYSKIVFVGGRMYVDVSSSLRSRSGAAFAQRTVSRYDAVAGAILAEMTGNKAIRASLSPRGSWRGESFSLLFMLPIALKALTIFLGVTKVDVKSILRQRETSFEDFRTSLAPMRGTQLIDAIVHSLSELVTTPDGALDASLITAAEAAFGWLRRRMDRWLGDPGAADSALSFPLHDPTLAMGMELHDIAGLAACHVDAGKLMARGGENAFAELSKAPGGAAVRDAMLRFMERYGSRCPGEIDIARPRWRDKPESIFPLLLALGSDENPVTGEERIARGRMRAEAEAETLLQRLGNLSRGRRKAARTRRIIALWREIGGYREYMKLLLVRRIGLIRERILEEADLLVGKGILAARDDVFHLFVDELREAIRTGRVDRGLIEERKREIGTYSKLSAPRVLTSEGECPEPAGFFETDSILTGIAASSGIAEGMVCLADDGASVRGRILVIQYPEPSLTPLFATAAAVVSESGGVLSHGAIIAREYGIPAVMGLEGALRKLRSGQKVRVNGNNGRVEIL